jgi:hypothetical protein
MSTSPGVTRLDPFDRLVLAFALAAMLSAAGLAALIARGHGALPAQSACWSQVVLDRDCPGCGLTRSFVAIGSGDLAGGIALNPLGPFLLGFAAAFAISRLAKLVHPSIPLRRFDLAAFALLAIVLMTRTIEFYFF